MDKLLFCTAGIPVKTKPRTYDKAFLDLVDMNLGGMELEFVRGVTMNPKTQELVRDLAQKLGLVITAHAPFYINLSSLEIDKHQASIKRILDTARVCSNCGGYSITFHAGFYMGQDKKEVYNIIKSSMENIIKTLRSEEIEIWLRPEITGKATQWGDLDEIICLSKELEMVLPCIDFAHLHARSSGNWNSYDKFCQVFEKIGNELGEFALKNFHAHIAGIEYGLKGEKKHLNLEESDLDYKNLLKAFKSFDVKGVVICESPNIEDDAMLMQNFYESI